VDDFLMVPGKALADLKWQAHSWPFGQK